MKFSWLTLLFAAAIPVIAQSSPGKQDLGTVTIQVIDEYGHTVPCRVVSFIDIYRKRDLVPRFRGLQGTEVPYGSYEYRLQRTNAPPGDELAGRATVYLPETLVVASAAAFYIPGWAVDTSIPRGFVIRGRLEPIPPLAPPFDPIRVRLSPIHRSEHLDLQVDRSGEFRIYRPLVGRYVLSVIRGADVLHVQLMSFEGSQSPLSFVVKLLDDVPAVQYVR